MKKANPPRHQFPATSSRRSRAARRRNAAIAFLLYHSSTPCRPERRRPVGSTEAEASFSGNAPALGSRRVRPAPDRKWFHCKKRQQLKNHAFKIQLYSQAKDEHKHVYCKKAALACIFYACFSAFVLA
jgi:hypothetical protein